MQSSGDMELIVYAVDISKSAKPLMEYQASLIMASASNCREEQEGYALVVYSSRAAPVVDYTRDPRDLIEALSSMETMKGIPEPVKAVKEALEIIYYRRAGVPAIGDLIIVLWSMPKQPKIPVFYAKTMVSSVGAGMKIVGLQYGPPKWLRSSHYDTGVDIIYRRRLREQDLAKKLGCTSEPLI